MNKKCILIVEDERIVAEDIKNTLTELDYDVAGITSTANAAVSKAKQTMPDLVLMDIVLKGKKDGIEAASRISTELNIPVVYLTAYGDEKIIERAKLTGPYGYIIKPFNKRELHSSVEIALHKKDMERRIEHLNAVLAAIRGVNQLITHERDRDTLLQEACNRLIKTRGYHDAIIMLQNIAGNVAYVFEAGLTEKIDIFVELVEKGEMPKCMRQALTQPGLTAMESPATSCKYCPLMTVDIDRGRLVRRLEKDEKVYGLLSVSLPESMASDAEEHSLFEEVAGDISFALHSMELKEKRSIAEEKLIASGEKWRSLGENLPAIVMIVQRDGTITFINKTMPGMTPEDVIGTKAYDFIPPENHHILRESIEHVFDEGEAETYEIKGVGPHGGTAWYSTIIGPIKSFGKVVFAIQITSDITDQKIAKEKLRESEDRFRQFFESAPDYCYMVSLDGNILDINTSAINALGYKKEELMGLPLKKIYVPESLPRMKELFNKWKLEEELKNEEMEIATKGGDHRTVLLSATAVRNNNGDILHSISVQRDITEMKIAESKLVESEERFRTMFEAATDGILLADIEERKFYTANDTMCNMLGYSLKEIRDLGVMDIHPDEKIEYVLDQFQKQASGEKSLVENIPVKRKDGTVFFVDVNSSPIVLERKKYLMGIFRDITERKRAEEELRQAYEELKRTQAHLVQSEKLAGMGTMAAGIAHEINNPLQVVLGMTEMILEDDDIKQVREDAKEILDAAERIRNIVKNLSVYSRDAKTQKTRPIDINQIIKKSLTMAKFSVKFLDTDVKLNLAEVPELHANPGELQQVFINLFTNAIDAMEGRGELKIRTCLVNDHIHIEISDTGKGIPAHEISKIFEPFFTTKEVGKGTGLGLHVIHQIVEKYGGTIEVESDVGMGSNFSIRLPVR